MKRIEDLREDCCDDERKETDMYQIVVALYMFSIEVRIPGLQKRQANAKRYPRLMSLSPYHLRHGQSQGNLSQRSHGA